MKETTPGICRAEFALIAAKKKRMSKSKQSISSHKTRTDVYEIRKGRTCPTMQTKGCVWLRYTPREDCGRLLNIDVDTKC